MNTAKTYSLAKERYAALGVDVEHALRTLATIPISLHCWQGDDVGGFENFAGTLGGGLVATSKARADTARRPPLPPERPPT